MYCKRFSYIPEYQYINQHEDYICKIIAWKKYGNKQEGEEKLAATRFLHLPNHVQVGYDHADDAYI